MADGADDIVDPHDTVLAAFPPHPLIDPLPRKEHTGVAGQQVQQPELRRGEIYRLPAHGDKLTLGIEGEVVEDNQAGWPLPISEDAGPGPAEQGADGCGALGGAVLCKAHIKSAFQKVSACICAGDRIKQQQGVFRPAQIEQEGQDQMGPLHGSVQRRHVKGAEHQGADGCLDRTHGCDL